MTEKSEELADGLRQVHVEAAGMLSVGVIEPKDMSVLIAGSLTGDRRAANIVRMYLQTCEFIRSAPTDQGALCGCCDRELDRSEFPHVAMIMPHIDSATTGIALGLCSTCRSGPQEEVSTRVSDAVRNVWPEARPLGPIHETGGHA